MPGKVRDRRSSGVTRGDRMPPIPKSKQTRAQRAAARELAATPRGGVIGPFVPALRSPEFMTRLQRLGEYLRYRSALGPRLTELGVAGYYATLAMLLNVARTPLPRGRRPLLRPLLRS